ncbi:MAG TPA: phosphoglycerate mutase [Novimethylophilus sp.]|jgi:hypothetical protein|uniref:phosphoglycerate mutase n=1 Tax=Novimethylophilus sp. TaxID=2137426 RepID=UPI002F3FE8C8
MKVKHLLQCHLLVKGLFPAAAGASPRLPGLEGMLAFGGEQQLFEGGAEPWLCNAFGVRRQHDWPVAPFAALGDGLAPGERYWLRADPVHLHLLRDSLTMADGVPLDLTLDEALALAATLNRHFAADGVQFLVPAAARWYLYLAIPSRMNTHPLSEAIGRDVDRLLPQGADAMQWHGRINEAQMLLHDHPVNLARAQRGQLAVNSIWPWGGGVLMQPEGTPFNAVWSQDALAQGLTAVHGIEAQPLPQSCAAWLHGITTDAHLLLLDQLDRADLRQDAAHWFQVLQQLEQQWFAPLLRQLKAGRVDSIHLHLAGFGRVRSYTVNHNNLWKFWRRPRPLETYLHD